MILNKEAKKYTHLAKAYEHLRRALFPVPTTPPISGAYDICSIQLVPKPKLIDAYRRAIKRCAKLRHVAYLEFGVYNGLSMHCMHEACRLESRTDIKLIGLDSFQGLPSNISQDDNGIWSPGQFTCTIEDTIRCLEKRGTPASAVTLEKCWYKDLRPERLLELIGEHEPAIVMIDCDAYSSARSALGLLSRIDISECTIFFDDWRLHDIDLNGGGEYRAFHEWLEEHPEYKASRIPAYSRKAEAFRLKKDET